MDMYGNYEASHQRDRSSAPLGKVTKIWNNGVGRFAEEGSWGNGLWMGLGEGNTRYQQKYNVGEYYSELKKQIDDNRRRKERSHLMNQRAENLLEQRLRRADQPEQLNLMGNASYDSTSGHTHGWVYRKDPFHDAMPASPGIYSQVVPADHADKRASPTCFSNNMQGQYHLPKEYYESSDAAAATLRAGEVERRRPQHNRISRIRAATTAPRERRQKVPSSSSSNASEKHVRNNIDDAHATGLSAADIRRMQSEIAEMKKLQKQQQSHIIRLLENIGAKMNRNPRDDTSPIPKVSPSESLSTQNSRVSSTFNLKKSAGNRRDVPLPHARRNQPRRTMPSEEKSKREARNKPNGYAFTVPTSLRRLSDQSTTYSKPLLLTSTRMIPSKSNWKEYVDDRQTKR